MRARHDLLISILTLASTLALVPGCGGAAGPGGPGGSGGPDGGAGGGGGGGDPRTPWLGDWQSRDEHLWDYHCDSGNSGGFDRNDGMYYSFKAGDGAQLLWHVTDPDFPMPPEFGPIALDGRTAIDTAVERNGFKNLRVTFVMSQDTRSLDYKATYLMNVSGEDCSWTETDTLIRK